MFVDQVGFVADGIGTVVRPQKWRVERWAPVYRGIPTGPRWYVFADSDGVVCAEAGVIDGSWYPLWHEAYEAARRGYALEFAELNGGAS